MNKQVIKKLMTALMITMGLTLFMQPPAMASSTKITFQVPIRVIPYTLLTGGYLACDVLHSGVKINNAVHAAGTYLLRYAQRPGNAVPVAVTAQRGKNFQKGDKWTCYFGLNSSKSRLVDPAHSTMRVNGTL